MAVPHPSAGSTSIDDSADDGTGANAAAVALALVPIGGGNLTAPHGTFFLPLGLLPRGATRPFF